MMHEPAAAIRVRVDPANPGQFFACCGLLELADRLWSSAEGWFEDSSFHLRTVDRTAQNPTLASLIEEIAQAPLRALDANDETASPIQVETPFHLRLDWWNDQRSGGDRLKVWAGRMSSVRISRAMQDAIRRQVPRDETLLDEGLLVYDPDDLTKKVEPFYFDSRRGSNARSLDIGFAPDAIGMTTLAYPAVELLCLIGMQRARPAPTAAKRVFHYFTWGVPLPPVGAGCAASGNLEVALNHAYEFEVGFRTDQRKHKAFMPARRL